nr:neurogenic locus notch protein 2 [Hymenolepis microstoma]
MNWGFTCLFITIARASSQFWHTDTIGTLDFELKYENKHGITANRKNCDAWPFNRLCDIYFEICITDEDGRRRNSPCNLFSKKTSTVRNTVALSYKFKVPYFTNQLLKVKIKAFDHDHFFPADNLGEFLFQFHPYEVSSMGRTELNATSTSLAHPSTTGRRGGPHCEEELNACEYEESKLGRPPCMNGGHCVVNPFNEAEFTCLCAPGWHGVHCEISLEARRMEDACELETSRLGHSPCANGGHCVVDPYNETEFTCLCAQGWQGPRCEVSSLKASAIVTVLSVLLLILAIGCVIGVVCCCRIFALPKIRQVIKKQNGVELVKVNGSKLSEVNNLYQLTPDEIVSPASSGTATWTTREDSSLVNLTQPSPKPNDDNDEYEYDAILEQLKCSSTKEVPAISEEEEDYEPINNRYQSALKSGAATSAVSNEYDEDTDDGAHVDTTLKRPLPLAPSSASDGDVYEFLCENMSG